PWSQLPEAVHDAILHGNNYTVQIKYKNRFGREVAYTSGFEGVLPYIERRYREADTDSARARWSNYLREIPCVVCGGKRLKPEVLAVTVGGHSIADVSELSLEDSFVFVNALTLTEREAAIAAAVLREIRARLEFLLEVGLGY